MNTKAWTDFSCKACQYLLESHAFDADVAGKLTAAALTGEDIEIADDEGPRPETEENTGEGQAEGEEDGEDLSFDALVRSVSPYFEAWSRL